MFKQRHRRRHPSARIAPREVVILEEGKRITGRLMDRAFVWTEEILSPEEWQAIVAANDEEIIRPPHGSKRKK